ncbi:hypothetical protein [Halococcus saccharolyticus]|uniref:Uncharacterized protein n=1 Tax=Halococcus saccharolyticus DSM 5350 TaxID=1227455 RepID=M0MII9_9EURY|nr:hypothetical protein [Halococcus saccharolyticus]EMA44270.1 hypothetical protein C449_12108 [Halococcus saccharolyticus DSM 5350]
MSSDDLRLSVGMTLVATTSGWGYRVQAVNEERVVARGPHGSQGVDRAELEEHIRHGLVEVEAWP